MSTPTAPGWISDPAGIHQYRYFDGARWTDQVSDDGKQKTDITGLGDLNRPLLANSIAPPGHAPVRRKSNTWIKVLLAVIGVGVLFIVGCTVLVAGGVNEAVNKLNEEQAAHAITPAVYESIGIGDSKSDVLATTGKDPENEQEFSSESFTRDEPLNSSCIYYNKAGGSFGDVYQLCFDGRRLTSKNAY